MQERYIDLLKNVNHIVVHDQCSDGTASAMILKQVLPNAKVTFCQYNTDLLRNLPAERGMLFCDFTPPLDRFEEFLDVEAIVLDHHGGPAEQVTKEFVSKGLGVFASEKDEKGISGAVLAYRHVFMPLMQDQLQIPTAKLEETFASIKLFAEVIGVRDTWNKADPRWQLAAEYTAAVGFWPWSIVEATPSNEWDRLLQLGAVLVQRQKEDVAKAVGSSYRFTTPKGRKVAVFSGGSKRTNDAADALEGECDCVVGFNYLFEDGACKIVLSTRSRGTFSCRYFVLAFGGGGHSKAAGFSQRVTSETPNPYDHIQNLFWQYESVEDQWLPIVSDPGFDERVKNKEVDPSKAWQALFPLGL